jgi:hypothetical protein
MADRKAREAKEAILNVFRAVGEEGEDKIKIVRERDVWPNQSPMQSLLMSL